MNRMKIMGMSIFVLGSFIRASVADLTEIEGLRMPYAHYEVSDIFGAAKLIKSILKNSEQLNDLLHNPADLLRATLLVGSIAAVVKISIAAVNGLSIRIPGWISKLYRYATSRCRKALGIAEGFDCDQLHLFTQTFEQVMAVWVDQGYKRAEREQANPANKDYWQFQCRFVRDTLQYIAGFLREHQQYYRALQVKKVDERKTCIEDDIDHASFLVQHIIDALQHLTAISERAVDPTLFDIDHTRKMVRITVILFKKLSAILSGDVAPVGNQTDYTIGQSFLPFTGITEL